MVNIDMLRMTCLVTRRDIHEHIRYKVHAWFVTAQSDVGQSMLFAKVEKIRNFLRLAIYSTSN